MQPSRFRRFCSGVLFLATAWLEIQWMTASHTSGWAAFAAIASLVFAGLPAAVGSFVLATDAAVRSRGNGAPIALPAGIVTLFVGQAAILVYGTLPAVALAPGATVLAIASVVAFRRRLEAGVALATAVMAAGALLATVLSIVDQQTQSAYIVMATAASLAGVWLLLLAAVPAISGPGTAGDG